MKFHQQKLIVFILSIIGLINCLLPLWKWEKRVKYFVGEDIFQYSSFGIIILICFILILIVCFIDKESPFEPINSKRKSPFTIIAMICFSVIFIFSIGCAIEHARDYYGRNYRYTGVWICLIVGLVGDALVALGNQKRMKSISSASKLQHTPILTQKDIAYERQKEIEQQKRQEEREREREREKQDKRVGTIITYVSIVILVATIFIALYKRTILSIFN